MEKENLLVCPFLAYVSVGHTHEKKWKSLFITRTVRPTSEQIFNHKDKTRRQDMDHTSGINIVFLRNCSQSNSVNTINRCENTKKDVIWILTTARTNKHLRHEKWTKMKRVLIPVAFLVKFIQYYRSCLFWKVEETNIQYFKSTYKL